MPPLGIRGAGPMHAAAAPKKSSESVRDVLVGFAKTFLASKKLNVEPTISPDGRTFEYNFSEKDKKDRVLDVLEKMVAGMIRELAGQYKVSVADEATGKAQEINFEPPLARKALMDFLADTVKTTFTDGEFDESQNTGVLLELTYRTVLHEFKNPTFVTDFPKVMSSKLGTSGRTDLVAHGVSVLSLYDRKDGDKTWPYCSFEIGALSDIFANLKDLQEVVDKYLPKEWVRLREMKPEDVPELLEIVRTSLETYWKGLGRKSQKKVIYLMNYVGSDVIKYIRGLAPNIYHPNANFPNVFNPNTNFHNMSLTLQASLVICEKWIKTTSELTSQTWQEEWNGEAYEDELLVKTAERIDEVMRLRCIFEQLLGLLSKQELQDIKIDQIFEPFRGMDPMDATMGSAEQWSRAVATFERRLEPVDSRIAAKLRNALGNATNSQLLLQVFHKYKDVIKRPSTSQEVSAERENLLSALQEMVDDSRKVFDKKEQPGKNGGRALAAEVSRILWSRQLKFSTEECLLTAKALLQDLPKMERFRETAEKLVSDIDKYEKECLLQWQTNVQGLIDDTDDPITVQITGSLLQKKDGKMVVTCSDRYAEIMADVRQLQACGFNISMEVQLFAAKAYKFFKQALQLRQLASWYNSFDVQILKCHRLLLQDQAAHFEQAVAPSSKEKKRIPWNNLTEADLYATMIAKMASTFASENRKLRKVHIETGERVVTLMNVDLLKHADKWKASLKEIRDKFTHYERSHSKKGVDVWKLHWDFQLYKALEHQYQLGLETLNENLAELKLELIFKQGMIQYRPSLEYLREKYYQKMKDFITIPLRFRGCGGADFFKVMPERNEQAVSTVYANGEVLFNKLTKLKRRFKDWVVLGTVDLEPFVLEHLTTIEDFKANFDMVKEKQRQLTKLEETIQVDCVTVSTAPLKAAIEDQLNRLVESIQNAIVLSAKRDTASIEEFLDKAMSKLQIRPGNLDEVADANMAYKEMNQERQPLEGHFKEFDNKNRLLRTMGFNPMDLGVIQGKWTQFQDALEAHEKVMDVQLDKMRTSLETNIAKFMKEVVRFSQHWKDSKPKEVSYYKTKDEIQNHCIDLMKEKRSELDDMKVRAEEIRRQCAYFEMPPPYFADLDDTEEDIVVFEEIWGVYDEFQASLEELTNEDWLTFRSRYFKFDDFARDWTAKLDKYGDNHVTEYIQKKCEVWTNMVPSLKHLRGEGFTPEHWSMMFKCLGLEKGLTADKLKFQHFVDNAETIVEKSKEVQALHLRAQGEIQIREALQELRAWGNSCRFQIFIRSERGKNVPLVKDWKDITTAVSDNESLLGSLKDSPYYVNFADEAGAWESKLIFLNELLPQMVQLQRKWIYLEPIFARGALPSEQARFRRVDKEFVNLMKDVEADDRVVQLTRRQELLNVVPSAIEQLDRCQKALNEYLEEKRDKFPRFYFIGDDDMLEILGQAQNPTVIQAHLKKLFAGIAKVQFDDSIKDIVAMCSSAGEVVPLRSPVTVGPEVEVWLGDLDIMMRETLREMLVGCCENFDVDKYPSQILCLREMVIFTRDAEKHILDGTLPQLKEELQRKLMEFTSSENRTDRVRELKMKALILDLIHNIEVVDYLTKSGIRTLDQWPWQMQLRFYIDEKSSCIIRMVDAQFNYTYEYQGNAPKLVHTPLTDKCYLTLTQGMHLGYGGNPYGPAGTGKTESVKALGNAMGRQVLVFNCDEGIDFKSMGRIFMGLCKCGAWGCFDEFNRLKEDQLSAISDMIQVIQAGLKGGENQVYLLSRNLELNPSAGIFVTMNPAGKNYGGRSKLPENLKQLFRPVAMTVPDTALICETELYSEGFLEAKIVGNKLVEVFNLSRDLLSSQQHYDWGLRALKTILRTAGAMRSAGRKAGIEEEPSSPLPPGSPISLKEGFESEIVIRSLRVNTLSKLTFEDSKIFNGIVADVFPDIGVTDIVNDNLTAAIKASMEEMKLQIIDGQIHKILQLNEAMQQRIGVCIVGPSGAGKSTLLKVLRRAYEKLGDPIPVYPMNPKAMPRQQLLGFMDMDTREWNDGVLTAAARKVMLEPATTRSWLWCDGDIDPEWVESLNSVLDDNRLLTMPSGERIQFGDNVNFMFETHSLAFASPATVSRLSVIYLSEEDVDVKSSVKSWLASLESEQSALISEWVDSFFYQAVEKLLATKDLVIATTRMGVVMSGLFHLSYAKNKSEFALGLIRGLGSYLNNEKRAQYALDIFKLCGETPVDQRRPLENYWDEETKSFQIYKYEEQLDFTVEDLQQERTVETPMVQRNLDIMRPWAGQRPFLLIGPEGAGKNMLVMNLFRGTNSKVAVINCSAQTNCDHVIQKLTQTCSFHSTNSGRVLRPKDGDNLVLFLKDLNLPKPDKYATTQLHCFLQQLILYKGYYAQNLEWIGIEKVQIVGSLNPLGGVGRYPLVTRFTAICSVLSVSYPSKDQLETVYTEYFAALTSVPPLCDHPKWGGLFGGGHTKELAGMVVTVYEQVKKRYNVDEKSHYIFTPRDVTKWVLSLLNYDMETSEFLDVMVFEGERIFADRLVSAEHRGKFRRILLEEVGFEKKKSIPLFVSFMAKAPKEEAGDSEEPASPLDGVDDLTGEEGEGDEDEKKKRKKDKKKKKKKDKEKEKKNKKQEEVEVPKPKGRRVMCEVDKEDLEEVLAKGLVAYSREYRDLEMLMIDETVEWLCRADRILSQPGGSLLFAGRPGVGRRNIVSLVTHLLRMTTFTLSMTKDYDLKSFKTELKTILYQAGIQNEEVCLVVEDHNLLLPEFIEIINSLLASGEVPGLYSPEELNAVLAPLQEECMAEGYSEGAYSFFVRRIQQRLHIALLFDPLGPDYELRCQSNPAIYTKCGILWIDQWSDDGMKVVPRMQLKNLYKKTMADAKAKAGRDEERLKELSREAEKKLDALTTALYDMHKAVGDVGRTPKRYVQFLGAYERTYLSQYERVSEHRDRLWSGLSKLREAEVSVDVLGKNATEQKKHLAIKQEQADKALEEIQVSMEKATEQKKEAEELKTQLGVESKELAKHKAEIENQLSGVQPILDAAKEAVSSINAANLNEIRHLKMPPEAIRDVLEAVLSLMGIFDTSWISMKKFLGQRGMVDSILHFDCHSITPELRIQVKNLIDSKPSSFKPEVIKRASVAAAPMAAWVLANLQYAEVLQKTQPLEAELAQLQVSQEKSQAKLESTQEQLKKLDRKVKEMKKTFKELTGEAEKLRNGLEKAEAILQGAQELLGKLIGEKDRWEEQVGQLDVELGNISNLSLLSAAYMTYIAGEDEDKRRKMMGIWKDILKVDYYVFKDFMRTESKLLSYKSEGLPADDLSMENGIVILESHQTCLIVDPAQQALEWLKNHLTNQKITLDHTTATDERFQTTLELAVRFGKTLIISEVDKVEPILYPLLRKDLMTAGPKRTVQIGEKNVDWQDSFRLYLVTRNPNLRLPPDAAALVTEVNFAITRSGLEGQLLGVTLQSERPELEEQKSKLLQQEEEYKMQLSELEELLLKQLATTQGSLLDNKELIDALNQIKTKSSVVKDSLEESRSLQESLDKQREEYRAFAKMGSTIYFLVQDLRIVNHMYQFALSIFMRLFRQALEKVDDSAGSITEKIVQLNQALVNLVYVYVSRSVFKEDRLLFGLHMCMSMFPEKFGEKERDFFMNITTFAADLSDSSAPSWVDTDSLAAYQAMVANLPELYAKLQINDSSAQDWQAWQKSPAPEQAMPKQCEDLTPFQKNLVMAVFRSDRLPVTLDAMVCSMLKLESLNPPGSNLQTIYEKETTSGEPVLMITTPGADPSQEWAEMAAKVVGPGKFTQLAMGGGQTEDAIILLKQAASNGDWLLLKNLHLVVAWVGDLEKEFTNLTPHENFRLWLTSEAHGSFPAILLRSSLKITFQSPPGVKKNLQRSFDMWGQDPFMGMSETQARIWFALAWFHAIIQERRTFIPQGWVKFYEFSIADLKAGSDVIAAQFKDNKPDWATVYGVFENAIYGGRLDNDYDIRILKTYLTKYFNDSMLGASGQPITLTKGVTVPSTKSYDDMVAGIQKFSDGDNTEVFNLPPNADRVVQRNAALKMIESLGKLKDVSTTLNAGFNREVWASKFKSLFTLWDGLTKDHKEIFTPKETPKKDLSPMASFVWMEVSIAHKIIKMVNSALTEIQKIVAGTALLTQGIHEVAVKLMAGDVPISWDKMWEGPDNVQMWIRYVCQRAIALQEWSKAEEQGTLLSNPLRLSHVFRPITFLNALRQETARQSKQPLDKLVLDSAWGDNGSIPNASVTITVEGLLVTGASYDGTSLAALQSDSPGLAACPPCKLAWVMKKQESDKTVTVPCYFSGSREKLLCGLDASFSGDREAWILSGFAFVLEP